MFDFLPFDLPANLGYWMVVGAIGYAGWLWYQKRKAIDADDSVILFDYESVTAAVFNNGILANLEEISEDNLSTSMGRKIHDLLTKSHQVETFADGAALYANDEYFVICLNLGTDSHQVAVLYEPSTMGKRKPTIFGVLSRIPEIDDHQENWRTVTNDAFEFGVNAIKEKHLYEVAA
jgi:hypothetical protein